MFAIVLTLLVLDLRVPTNGGGDLPRSLSDLWPRLLSYLLTFLVAGQYWLAHHWDFEHIIRYDRRLLSINLMFLLSVSLLPFSTALLGDLGAVAWSVYAVNMLLAGLTLTAVWGYAVSHGLVDPMVTPGVRHYVILRHLVTPAVFLVSMPVALLAPTIAIYTPVLIPVLLRIVDRRRGMPSRDTDGRHDRLWQLLGYLPLVVFVAWSVWLLTIYRH